MCFNCPNLAMTTPQKSSDLVLPVTLNMLILFESHDYDS